MPTITQRREPDEARRPLPASHPEPSCPRRSLREQLERAAQVQRSLLPDVSVPLGNYRIASLYCPCETLGGDFYDLVYRRDEALLLVADVMGHGVEAALITMIVKAVFQEAAPSVSEPSSLLAAMNGRLHRIIPGGVYVAAAAIRLELKGSEVELANAGLPYPFVLRALPHRVEQVRLAGLPLGLFPHSAPGGYHACRLRLAPGDVLLIASDGIGSIEGEDGQCFEDRRLPRLLARLTGHEGTKVIDDLLAEAVDFGHGRPLPDDINLIAMSCDGRTTQRPGVSFDALRTQPRHTEHRARRRVQAGAATAPREARNDLTGI